MNAQEELFEALVVWLEGGARSALLDEHERADPEGFAKAEAVVRSVLATLDDARLAPLSAAARARAEALLSPTPGARMRSFFARLVPIAPLGAPGLALRAAAGPSSFQALYEAAGHDIDLALSEDGHLLGQVLARAVDPAARSAFVGGRGWLESLEPQHGEPLRESTIAPDGSFAFASYPKGRARLVLEGEGIEIVLDELELPAP